MIDPAGTASAGQAPSLLDHVAVPPPPAVLHRWLPAWAVPPRYADVQAYAVPSAVLSGHPDRDTAGRVLGAWAAGYGRCVAAAGAPDAVVRFAGLWQLAGHLAAAAVTADLGAAGDETLCELVAAMQDRLWPAWGHAAAPDDARVHAGLAVHRHLSTWDRQQQPPDNGLTELVRCAVTTGAQVPAAQHRLMHRVLQRPDQLRAIQAVIVAAGRA